MALPYRQWSEDEINNRNVSPDGEYPFTVAEAILKQTRGKLDDHGQVTGKNPMLELSLKFHDVNGVVKSQKDWIVFSDGMDWKLRHLANTLGLLQLYEAGSLTEKHLVGKSGVLSLGQRENEYNGEKRMQNFVKDYITKPTNDTNFLNDDIPDFTK